MHDQPKYEPLEPSAFFDDGRASRPLVEGTVARGRLASDAPLETGRDRGGLVRTNPLPVTEALLHRGRERYDVYCSVCHDRVGTGGGMIVRRGFRRPPSLHLDRLRAAEDGYLFDVVTQGFGVMPSYAQPIAAADRWAIVAYVRALQLSQRATLADVPPAERPHLERARGTR
jgi:mono/diheme cytochrome c family protein